MRIWMVVALTTALAGCAPLVFTHPTKTATDFERDKYECEGEAMQRARAFGDPGNPFIIRDEIVRCLEIKHGWKAAPAPEQAQ